MAASIAQWKKDDIEEMKKIIADYPIVALVSVKNIPSAQLQKMRAKMRTDKVAFKVSKLTLIELALKSASKSKPNVDKLIEGISGDQVALVASRDNPFKLFKNVDSTKAKSPAKGGETAPADITIASGETGFKPGPIVSELQKVGIPAAIDKGKVTIKETKVLVKAGDKIPRTLAPMLTKLDIFPLIVGLDLLAAYENQTIYKANVLKIDEAAFMGSLRGASSHAFNLSVFSAYPTKTTIKTLIQKAHRESVNVSINTGILTKDTAKMILANTQAKALHLSAIIKSKEVK